MSVLNLLYFLTPLIEKYFILQFPFNYKVIGSTPTQSFFISDGRIFDDINLMETLLTTWF